MGTDRAWPAVSSRGTKRFSPRSLFWILDVAASQSQAAAPVGAVSAGEAPGKYPGHAACVCVEACELSRAVWRDWWGVDLHIIIITITIIIIYK